MGEGLPLAWTHNTERSGDGTIPVIVHASRSNLPKVHGGLDEWHESTAEEYAAFEDYWAKEFPHMPQYVIEEPLV